MRFHVYYCKDDNYSKNYIKAEFVKNLLILQNGDKLEITPDFNVQIAGHSEDRFNVLFKDDNVLLEEDDRKYFAKLTSKQLFIVKWQFKQTWIQKDKNFVWVIGAIGGIIAFLINHYLKK